MNTNIWDFPNIFKTNTYCFGGYHGQRAKTNTLWVMTEVLSAHQNTLWVMTIALWAKTNTLWVMTIALWAKTNTLWVN
jgi:hypothetical protein